MVHPDKNLNNPQANFAFQVVEKAYNTLNDPEKKPFYVRIMQEAKDRIELNRKKEMRRREQLGLTPLPDDTLHSEIIATANLIFREI